MSDVLFGEVDPSSPGNLDTVFETRILKRHPPRRPSVPSVFWLAMACYLGACAAEALSWRSYIALFDLRLDTMAYMCLLACAIALLISFRAMGMRQSAALMMSFVLASCGIGLLWWNSWGEDVDMLDAAAGMKRLVVSGDVRQGKRGPWSMGCLIGDDGSRMDVIISWPDDETVLPAGTLFSAYGSTTATPSTERGRWNHRQGISGTVNVYTPRDIKSMPGLMGLILTWRTDLAQRLEEIDGQGSALMAGIVLGDQSRIRSTSIYDSFRICGLSHLIAVSGSHLMVVSALAGWLLERLRCARRTRLCVLLSVLIIYLVLSGLQISALRALVMTSVGLASYLFARRADRLSACSICAMVLILLDPRVVFSFAFNLSVCAVLGIIVFSPLLRYWLAWPLKRRRARLADPVALTLSAQMTTLPLTVPVFSLLPLGSPIANLIVTPLISILLGAGVVALPISCLLPRPLSDLVLNCLCACADLVCRLVDIIARIPGMSIAASWSPVFSFVAVAGFVIVLWALWPLPDGPRVRACLIILLVAFAVALVEPYRPSPPEVIMLDVGQGDAIIVREGGSTLLIDTGPDDAVLLDALARNHVRHLDAVVITHLHDDHYGALDALTDTVTVDEVYFSEATFEGGYADSEAVAMAISLVGSEHVGSLRVGDQLSLGDFTFTVLSPESLADDGGNADSIVMSMDYDPTDGSPEVRGLFCGDAEHDVLAALEQQELIGDIDILKVGHHGSSVSLTPDDMELLTPAVALIDVGADNDYGHPDEGTLDVLEEGGALVYRTDIDGDILVRMRGDGLRITCDTIDP